MIASRGATKRDNVTIVARRDGAVVIVGTHGKAARKARAKAKASRQERTRRSQMLSIILGKIRGQTGTTR